MDPRAQVVRTRTAGDGSVPGAPANSTFDADPYAAARAYLGSGAVSMRGQAAPPPGWYTDSTEVGLLRWWDGASWASRTSDVSLRAAPEPAEPEIEEWALDSAGPADDAEVVPPARYHDRGDDVAMRWGEGSNWSEQAQAVVRPPVPVDLLYAATKPEVEDSPEAGWYVDDDGVMQWWDGSAWSAHTFAVHARALLVNGELVAGGGEVHGAPEPGWYATDEGPMQWWDGSEWTEHTVRKATASIAELASAPEIASTTGAGWYVDPVDARRMRWWNGADWTSLEHPFAPVQGTSTGTVPAHEHDQAPVPAAVGSATAAAAATAVEASPPVPPSDTTSDSAVAGQLIEPPGSATTPVDSATSPDIAVDGDETVNGARARRRVLGGMSDLALPVADQGLHRARQRREARPPRVVKQVGHHGRYHRPAYASVWFWVTLLASAALWFIAWSTSQDSSVPAAPSISVVAPPKADPSQAQTPVTEDSPLPTLTPQPLG